MRFYTTNAPKWWSYHVLSLAFEGLGAPRESYVLLDNGMFSFYKKGFRPSLDLWLSRLRSYALRVLRALEPRELLVVAPDWLWDPEFTIEAARKARRIFARDFKLVGVCHYSLEYPVEKVVEELSSYVDVVAVPLKLNCSYFSAKAGRRIVRYHAQRALVERAYVAAKAYGLGLHGLGLSLKPDHVVVCSKCLTSFDTTSWTRPNATVLQKLGFIPRRWSCKNAAERDLFFALAVKRLVDNGIRIEGSEIALKVWEGLVIRNSRLQ